LEDFAFDVDRDLLRQVAVRDRRRHRGDVTHLGGEVGSHGIHRVGEVLPRAGNTGDLRLAAEFAFGADFAGDTSHFSGEGGELVDHRVDDVLDLEDFAADVDRDFLRQVAGGNGRRDLRHVAQLDRQVAGHEIHVVRKVLPGAGD